MSNVLNPQNAALQLEAIKSVDGPGSGLDADTLDGLHAGGLLQVNQAIVPNTTLLACVKDAYNLTPDKAFRAFVLSRNGGVFHAFAMRTDASYGVVAVYGYDGRVLSLYVNMGGTWRSKILCNLSDMSTATDDQPMPGPEIMDDTTAGGGNSSPA